MLQCYYINKNKIKRTVSLFFSILLSLFNTNTRVSVTCSVFSSLCILLSILVSKLLGLTYKELGEIIGYSESALTAAVVKDKISTPMIKAIELLLENNIRVKLDDREEKLGYKMREAQMKKIPFTLVIGDKEKENKTVTYRKYGTDMQIEINLNDFIEMLNYMIKNKEK